MFIFRYKLLTVCYLIILVLLTDNLINTGKLVFVPDSAAVRELVSSLNQTYPNFNYYYHDIYSSEADAIAWALRTNYTLDNNYNPLWPYDQRCWAIISFNELNISNGQIDYTIRMNYSTVPSTRSLQAKFKLGLATDYQDYYFSGFVSLQHMIEDYLLNRTAITQNLLSTYSSNALGPQSSSRLSSYYVSAPMPTAYSNTNPFYSQAGPFVGLVLTLSLLYPISRLLKNVDNI